RPDGREARAGYRALAERPDRPVADVVERAALRASRCGREDRAQPGVVGGRQARAEWPRRAGERRGRTLTCTDARDAFTSSASAAPACPASPRSCSTWATK